MKKKYNYWMLFILMATGLLCGCGATRKIAEYEGTPVAITYSENGEAHNEWQITDIATINACEQALKQLTISKKTELRSADAGETFVFQMADGGTWTLEFEGGNLLQNGICYETKGWKEVRKIIQDYLEEEGL